MGTTCLEVRRARMSDATAMGRIFRDSFADTVKDLLPGGAPDGVFEDIMTFLIRADPDACLVAESGGSVIGYCIAPANMFRIWIRAPLSRRMLRLAWSALLGDLGLGPRRLLTLLGDKAAFFSSFGVARFRGAAQILSVAVDPVARGRGVGSSLVEAALERLRADGVHFVKLEVRPDNDAARRMYEKRGFVRQGRTEDSHGRWLVMLKDLREDDEEDMENSMRGDV